MNTIAKRIKLFTSLQLNTGLINMILNHLLNLGNQNNLFKLQDMQYITINGKMYCNALCKSRYHNKPKEAGQIKGLLSVNLKLNAKKSRISII